MDVEYVGQVFFLFNIWYDLQILEIIRVILKLYDQWKNFDDRKEIAGMLNKMPKPKPPPNRYVPCGYVQNFIFCIMCNCPLLLLTYNNDACLHSEGDQSSNGNQSNSYSQS